MPARPLPSASPCHPPAHCCHCGALAPHPTETPSPARRRGTLGLFAALLLAPLPRARAADDLLDPSVLQRKGGNDTSSVARPASPGAEGSTTGRAMAASVVSSLDGLTAAAAARMNEITRLDKRIAELQDQLRRARELLTETMNDYRQGLFCSGCNKTKTEILKAGDTFPHPGQQIVRATQQQIDAKEREMQQPIDRALRELQELQAARRKAAAERDEALAQIDAGLALWNTSLAFERQALELQRQQAERSYSGDRQALDSAANRLNGAAPAVQRERDTLRTAQLALEKRRRNRKDALEAVATRAAASSAEEQQRLDGFLARSPLPRVLSATATIAYVHQAAGFNDLGGLYRMGDFNVARRDEALPQVERFIASYRKLPAAPAPAPQPAQDTSTSQKLRNLLQDLAACEPDDAFCKTRPPNGGSGLRG